MHRGETMLSLHLVTLVLSMETGVVSALSRDGRRIGQWNRDVDVDIFLVSCHNS